MLHGRFSAEAAIERVLSGARTSIGAGLLLRGEEGTGKTALLDFATTRCGEMTALRAGGTVAERQLPYAVLHQLLRPFLDLVDELPLRQADALRFALGFRVEKDVDRFVVPLAVLDLLSERARKSPLVILVDDAHLIDHETASVLAFIGQRLHNESIALVMTAQVVDDYAFGVHGVTTIDLGPIDAAAVAGILLDCTGERPSPHVVDEVLAASLGNPKAAAILASSLAADEVAGRAPVPIHLPIARSHEAPLLARLRELPKATQTLLLISALEESGDAMKLFAAAQGLGLSVISTLEPAEATGIIDVAGVSVTFREPLMREAIKRAASFRDRRAVHLALASLLEADGDREMALWHRAQATLGPTEEIAAELEEAAGVFRRSSGCALATKVLERSADLSLDASRKAFRSTLAAEAAFMAGQVGRSLSLSDAAYASPNASPSSRARALLTRGRVLNTQGNAAAAIEALMGAAAIAEDEVIDPLIVVDASLTAAATAFAIGDLERTGRFMRRAAGLPPGTEERVPYQFGFVPGSASTVGHDAASRVPALGEAAAAAVDRSSPHWLALAARIATAVGDGRGAMRHGERALRLAREEGAIGLMPELLMVVASANSLLERSAAAETDATEALRLAEELGQHTVVMQACTYLAWITAIQGRVAECQQYAERSWRVSASLGYTYFTATSRYCLALLDIGLGNHEQAYTTLLDEYETHPVAGLWTVPDLVEASIRSRNRPSSVAEHFARYDQWVQRYGIAAGVARREHCHGLLHEGQEAISAFESALGYQTDERSFDHARTRLAFGEVLRRSRRRSDARVQLRAALETFEMLGAAPWANRARSELRASGETSSTPASTDDELEMLTPQELQIARLVGTGLTNREIAAQLFLSHRTVEYHLHKMFAKLNVTSRSELVRLVMETIDLNEVDATTVVK